MKFTHIKLFFLIFIINLFCSLVFANDSGLIKYSETQFGLIIPNPNIYEPRGIGGGGAMSGFSISPYSSLWFVGTDMGTLFRSTDEGKSWYPVNHLQTTFHFRLANFAYIGFNPDPDIVFHSPGGKKPQRSMDGGLTWNSISIPLKKDERIKYWLSDSFQGKFVYCATTDGMFFSSDKGKTWTRSEGVAGLSKGSFIDYIQKKIYHSNTQGIYVSDDHGKQFKLYHKPEAQIISFTGGRDDNGITLAYTDQNGKDACKWVTKASKKKKTIRKVQKSCGYVWINRQSSGFQKTRMTGGEHIKMAENDSQTIYVTGSREWPKGYGTKIWKSRNAGKTWKLTFRQLNWDKRPFSPWPSDKFEYSAVGVDVGWWDAGYRSFSINRRKSSVIGGTGNFFLHVSKDYGEHWLSPFTRFADTGKRKKGKKWSSTGLEMTSVFRFKFHPKNPFIAYAAAADIGGLVSEDGGHTFKISKIRYNTNYDYAFDPDNDRMVFGVSGSIHDFPYGSYGTIKASGYAKRYNYPFAQGGVFYSKNRGKNWKRLTPEKGEFNRQFLSIACSLKGKNKYILYAGSQGDGIARSIDSGRKWHWYNQGLPNRVKTDSRGYKINQMIITQIEIDPANGDVYALLSGNSPKITNSSETGIYYLDVSKKNPVWSLLRTTVHRPEKVENKRILWKKPTAFAIDLSDPDRNTFWLVDMETEGEWLATGAWKTTDRGQNWYRMIQFTHPMSVVIDPNDSNRVYLGGKMTLSGKWGNGGPLYTTDGGMTWKKNLDIPLQGNLHNITIDPNNENNLFYTFFGGGMLYGPKPD